jgi:hypothetical protein
MHFWINTFSASGSLAAAPVAMEVPAEALNDLRTAAPLP